MRYLLLFVLLLGGAFGAEPVAIAPGSPQETVLNYYAAAREGEVDKANSYLSSHDHKKFERFPVNRTVGIKYVKKHAITPRIEAVKTDGGYAAVATVYKDPTSPIGADRIEYLLVVKEDEQWKLVLTSRPYIGDDAAYWKNTPDALEVIRRLEAWYEERKKDFNARR